MASRARLRQQILRLAGFAALVLLVAAALVLLVGLVIPGPIADF